MIRYWTLDKKSFHDLEMHVGTGRMTCSSNLCNELALLDALANLDQIRRIVTVKHSPTVIRSNDASIAVATFRAAFRHNAGSSGQNSRTFGCSDVRPFVIFRTAINGILSPTDRGRDNTADRSSSFRNHPSARFALRGP